MRLSWWLQSTWLWSLDWKGWDSALLYKLYYTLQYSIHNIILNSLWRYIAVYKPVEYNMMTNDASSHCKRLVNYILPITLFSVIFNLPKFLGKYQVWSINKNLDNTNKSDNIVTQLYSIQYSKYTTSNLIIGVRSISFSIPSMFSTNRKYLI